MHDADFVQGLLAEVKSSQGLYHTADRIRGLLTVVSEVSNTMMTSRQNNVSQKDKCCSIRGWAVGSLLFLTYVTVIRLKMSYTGSFKAQSQTSTPLPFITYSMNN